PDMGALYILPRIVGDGVARDMIYTRREIRAEEAKILGLVNEIYEDLEKGIDEYTKKLLSVPNFALREAKMLIEKGWNQNFKENLLDTKEAQVRCVMEAVGKFKR
ncbi:MAG: enoyl-CoA hydratase-related protein, partial [Archaeoglobaceae archaeon]